MSTAEPEDFRCAPWTEAQGVDPCGSAASFDTLCLVEVPLPWPRDVSDLDFLRDAVPLSGQVRFMAVLPEHAGSYRMVTVWNRDATGGFTGIDYAVTASELRSAVPQLVTSTRASRFEVGQAPPEALICGHGRRDRCCGRLGVRLERAVANKWPHVRIRRCSHTGGHRFAPTGLTLPDGRTWAYLNPEVFAIIMRKDGEARDLHRHYRGSAAVPAWGQVVERELFQTIGTQRWNLSCTECRVQVTANGNKAHVSLTWRCGGRSGRAEADVCLGRELPVLDCGQAPVAGLKLSHEYLLESFEISD